MEMKPVKSSQIHSVGHDPATKTLAVRFYAKGEPGPVYHYPEVTAEQHTAFLGAESIGKHFHANFRSLKGVRQP